MGSKSNKYDKSYSFNLHQPAGEVNHSAPPLTASASRGAIFHLLVTVDCLPSQSEKLSAIIIVGISVVAIQTLDPCDFAVWIPV